MFLNYHLTQYHTDMSERLAKNIPGCQNKGLEETKYKIQVWSNTYGPNSLEGKNHSGKKQDRLADQWQARNVTVKLVWTALISQMCFKIPHVFRKTESILLSDATKKSPLSYKTDSLWNLWTSQREKLSVKLCVWHMCPSLEERI